MAIISGFAVLAKEPQPKQFQNGTFLVEVPVYMNDYVPGVGYIKKNAIAVFWGQEGHKIMRFAQNHKRQDQTPTGGKGMPVFIAGYTATDSFRSSRDQSMVYMEKIHVFHTGFQKIPIFESVGVIGSQLKERTVQTATGPSLLVEALVFFNGYFPGLKDGSLSVFVSFWGEKAQWLLDKAKSHTKNNVPTGGKGMFLDIACCIYTNTYKNAQGEDVSFTKATALDVKFSSNAFVRDKNNNQGYNNNQSYNNNQGYPNNQPSYNNNPPSYNNNQNYSNPPSYNNNQQNHDNNSSYNNQPIYNAPPEQNQNPVETYNQQTYGEQNTVPKNNSPFEIPNEFSEFSQPPTFVDPSQNPFPTELEVSETALPDFPNASDIETTEEHTISSNGSSLDIADSSKSAFEDLQDYFKSYNK